MQLPGKQQQHTWRITLLQQDHATANAPFGAFDHSSPVHSSHLQDAAEAQWKQLVHSCGAEELRLTWQQGSKGLRCQLSQGALPMRQLDIQQMVYQWLLVLRVLSNERRHCQIGLQSAAHCLCQVERCKQQWLRKLLQQRFAAGMLLLEAAANRQA